MPENNNATPVLMTANFADQQQSLIASIKRDWNWPTLDAGFAYFVFTSQNESVPFLSEDQISDFANGFARTPRWDYAHVLAEAGYAAATNCFPAQFAEAWRAGIARLRACDPFPLDREAFPFRPLELLGIALGVAYVPNIGEDVRDWLKEILQKTESKVTVSGLWARSLGLLAASQIGVSWKAIEETEYQRASLEGRTLIYWLRNLTSPTGDKLLDISSDVEEMEHRILQDFATQKPQVDELNINAILLFALGRICRQTVATVPLTKTVVFDAALITSVQDDLKSQFDFAIICVREDEYAAVLKRFPQQFLYKGRKGLYSIHCFSLHNGGTYSIAVVRCPEQGTMSAQSVTNNLIDDLDPQYIMVVGIGGGIPAAEFTLGDVVTAMRLHDFSVHSRLQGGVTEYASGGGPMTPEVRDILAALPAMTKNLGDWNTVKSIGFPPPPVEIQDDKLYGSDDSIAKTRRYLERHWGESALPHLPKIVSGSIASSDALLKDADLIEQWQQSARQLVAVEMELSGVYAAARTHYREYPIIAIRGISDIVGFKRHDDWAAYACETAASFAHALIRTGVFSSVDKNSRRLRRI